MLFSNASTKGTTLITYIYDFIIEFYLLNELYYLICHASWFVQ